MALRVHFSGIFSLHKNSVRKEEQKITKRRASAPENFSLFDCATKLALTRTYLFLSNLRKFKMKLLAIFIIIIVNKYFIVQSAPNQPEDDDNESSLLDFSDDQIEEEARRRWFGGPWSAEDASAILNQALDQVSNSADGSSRRGRFFYEAKQLLEMLTSEESAELNYLDDSREDDPDYMDEPVQVGSGHVVSRETMSKIVDMFDGLNGQIVCQEHRKTL